MYTARRRPGVGRAALHHRRWEARCQGACAQVLVTDTAGVRPAAGPVEAEGVRRALAAAAAADVLVVVADAAAHPPVAAAAAAAAAAAGAHHSVSSEPCDAGVARPAARFALRAVDAGQGAAAPGRQSGGWTALDGSRWGGGAAADDSCGSAGPSAGEEADAPEARVAAACRSVFADLAPVGAPAGRGAARGAPLGGLLGELLPHGAAGALAAPHAEAACPDVAEAADVHVPASETGLDAALAERAEQQQVLLVANKWDLIEPGGPPAAPAPGEPAAGGASGGAARWRVCAASCRTGAGQDALLTALAAAVAAAAGGADGAAGDAALVARCAPSRTEPAARARALRACLPRQPERPCAWAGAPGRERLGALPYPAEAGGALGRLDTTLLRRPDPWAPVGCGHARCPRAARHRAAAHRRAGWAHAQAPGGRLTGACARRQREAPAAPVRRGGRTAASAGGRPRGGARGRGAARGRARAGPPDRRDRHRGRAGQRVCRVLHWQVSLPSVHVQQTVLSCCGYAYGGHEGMDCTSLKHSGTMPDCHL